jgi:molybdate transport system substrate-binding protein
MFVCHVGILGFLMGLLVMLAGPSAQGQTPPKRELRVAAASDLQPVMPTLAAEYEKAKGVKLVVSYGSSATLATQILNGAPIDIFLAADFIFPERVVAAGLADMTSPEPYAKGTLVLWARKDSPLQPIAMDSLTDKRVTSIAIAAELHAPYGRAAVSALNRMKIYEQVKPHLVIAENIAQAGQYVESGNAQLGLISLTMASTEHFKGLGTYVLVPTQNYPAVRQCAVVLKTDRKAEAHAFLAWMLSPEVQNKLPGFGLASVR